MEWWEFQEWQSYGNGRGIPYRWRTDYYGVWYKGRGIREWSLV